MEIVFIISIVLLIVLFFIPTDYEGEEEFRFNFTKIVTCSEPHCWLKKPEGLVCGICGMKAEGS